jgi:hypothetical protein
MDPLIPLRLAVFGEQNTTANLFGGALERIASVPRPPIKGLGRLNGMARLLTWGAFALVPAGSGPDVIGSFFRCSGSY